jgi:hypothetical protein
MVTAAGRAAVSVGSCSSSFLTSRIGTAHYTTLEEMA